MDSLYIVREFVDDLQSIVQLPNNGQQQLGWKPKDLTVAQSHEASSQGRVSKSSFFQCPYISPAEGVAQIKGCRSPTEGVARLQACESPAEDVAQFKGVCLHAFNPR